jgi:hypothetical protein
MWKVFDGTLPCRWISRTLLKDLKQGSKSRRKDDHRHFIIRSWSEKFLSILHYSEFKLKKLGFSVVDHYYDLPDDRGFDVHALGYAPPAREVSILRLQSIPVHIRLCPSVSRLDRILNKELPFYQNVLVNTYKHPAVTNILDNADRNTILVDGENFRERIPEKQSGKPFRIIGLYPEIQGLVDQIEEYLSFRYPERKVIIENPVNFCTQTASVRWKEVISTISADESYTRAVILTETLTDGDESERLLDGLSSLGLTVDLLFTIREFRKYWKQHKGDSVLAFITSGNSLFKRRVLTRINRKFPFSISKKTFFNLPGVSPPRESDSSDEQGQPAILRGRVAFLENENAAFFSTDGTKLQ